MEPTRRMDLTLALSATLREDDACVPRVIEGLRAYVGALEDGTAGNHAQEILQFGDLFLHTQADITVNTDG